MWRHIRGIGVYPVFIMLAACQRSESQDQADPSVLTTAGSVSAEKFEAVDDKSFTMPESETVHLSYSGKCQPDTGFDKCVTVNYTVRVPVENVVKFYQDKMRSLDIEVNTINLGTQTKVDSINSDDRKFSATIQDRGYDQGKVLVSLVYLER